MSFRIVILTPEGRFLDEDAEGLVLPVPDGRLGVLAGHAPMLAAVSPGVLVLRRGDGSQFFAVGSGTAEIGRETVTLVTEAAVRAADALEAEAKTETRRALLAEPVPSAEVG